MHLALSRATGLLPVLNLLIFLRFDRPIHPCAMTSVFGIRESVLIHTLCSTLIAGYCNKLCTILCTHHASYAEGASARFGI
ncbi:hypothetical protein H4582DRAFT_1367705 [Lactarius indigo]|nr:hypothetical protein H4582DRAFT_1367705 [Lactarius indigo]